MNNQGFIDLYYYLQDKLVPVDSYKTSTSVYISGYEVIKIVSGIPLFYGDHLERLNNTLELAGFTNFKPLLNGFYEKINQLCKANEKYFGNVEFRISKTLSAKNILLLGFIPHNYPNPTDYLSGIATDVLFAERDNPNAKIKNTETRKKADQLIMEKNVSEVLLVNHQGLLTEGSRSNLFIIKNELIFTAADSDILKGITRKYVVQVIEQLGLNLVKKGISFDHLHEMDAAFICGTSPGILPIHSVGNIQFNPHHAMIKKIVFEFNQIVQAYLSEKA